MDEKRKKHNKSKQIKTQEEIGEVAKARLISNEIRQATEKVLSSIIDFTLFSLVCLPASSFGKTKSSRAIYQMFSEADQMAQKINYIFFKNALRKMRDKGFINSVRSWKNKKIATHEGLLRLKSLVPFYDEKRFWDGKLYLIQYDVPRFQNRLRDLFRHRFLHKLRALPLQASSYLVFFNPQDLIANFLKDKSEFEGNIIISQLTKDGFLGEETIEEFIWNRSVLPTVNSEYELFIDRYQKQEKFEKAAMFRDYFAILKKDPQIPFELLPPQYLGDKAYLLFLKYFKRTLFFKYVRTK